MMKVECNTKRKHQRTLRENAGLNDEQEQSQQPPGKPQKKIHTSFQEAAALTSLTTRKLPPARNSKGTGLS